MKREPYGKQKGIPLKMKDVLVIVVDDDLFILDVVKESIRFFLKKEGERKKDIVGFNNPQNCLEYLQNNPADIIISDIDMGTAINGIGLLRRVKFEFPEMIFICMSGNPGHKEEAFEGKADFFLQKPFMPNELLEVITAFVADR